MRSPILFVIFKRADTTRKVFERIREVKPSRLYIAADGPHRDNLEEVGKCEATRKIVETIDWPCEIHRLYREENLGCGEGVSRAITWFFEHEEEGIIIEDDVLPHPDFFRFCDEMLEKYRDVNQIKCICGSNYFYEEISHPDSYYFSHFLAVWGWATWRRTWKEYDKSLKSIPRTHFIELVNALPVKKGSKQEAINIFDIMTSERPIDTWDYQLIFSIWQHEGLNVMPITNLCKNIGFGHVDASHTIFKDENIESHTVKSCYPIIHPLRIADCAKLDKITFLAAMYTPDYGLALHIRRLISYIRIKLGIRTRIKRFSESIKNLCGDKSTNK